MLVVSVCKELNSSPLKKFFTPGLVYLSAGYCLFGLTLISGQISSIIIIITLQYDVHAIEGESLQSVSEQVVGVHTDRICQVDIPGLKLDLMVILTTRTNYMITTN